MQFERSQTKSSLSIDCILLMRQLSINIRRTDNEDFEGSDTNIPD
jgi:hypothetical protein